MVRSDCKTLKTVENLAQKPDNTLRTCLNLVNSFLECDQISLNLQESERMFFKNFFWVQFCTSLPEKINVGECALLLQV